MLVLRESVSVFVENGAKVKTRHVLVSEKAQQSRQYILTARERGGTSALSGTHGSGRVICEIA